MEMKELRDFIRKTVGATAATADDDEYLSHDTLTSLKSAGLFGWNIRREFGGQGRSASDLGNLHFELGRTCTSTRAVITAHQLVVEVLERWGSLDQRTRWLTKMADGQTIACFALSEERTGSNPQWMSTVAARCGDGYLINGRKRWVTSGLIGDVALVAALVEGEPSTFLVPLDSLGIGRDPVRGLLGFRAAMVGDLSFKDTPVDADALIGPIGTGLTAMVGTGLDLGRYVTAWGAAGLVAECLFQAREYAFQLDAAGRRGWDRQLVRRLLSRMFVSLAASEALCRRAAHLRDANDPAAIDAAVVAKYYCSNAAVDGSREAIEVIGAAGCSGQSVASRFYRDAKILEIIEGTNETLEDIMGGFWHDCFERV